MILTLTSALKCIDGCKSCNDKSTCNECNYGYFLLNQRCEKCIKDCKNEKNIKIKLQSIKNEQVQETYMDPDTMSYEFTNILSGQYKISIIKILSEEKINIVFWVT